MSEPIYFYTKNDPYYELSNFAPYGLTADGVYWTTVEHYFQAQKFHDADYRERIRRALTPKDAKVLGQSRAITLRADWEVVKVELMHFALRQKFTRPEWGELLISTGDGPLYENSPSDYFWGIGQDGSGQNMLGQLLELVRKELKSAH